MTTKHMTVGTKSRTETSKYFVWYTFTMLS